MSNTYTFTGRVVHVSEVEEVGQKGTPKMSFVVSDEAEKWPTEIAFEAIGKSVAKVEPNVHQGEQVTVSFDVKSRHWKQGDKWFTSANAWQVDRLGSKPSKSSSRSDPNQNDMPLDEEDDLDSDVPF